MRTTYKTQYWTGTLGDTITTGNLTLNAGLRYDYQQGRNLPGYRLANNSVPGAEIPFADFHGNEGWPFTYKNLAAPRLGHVRPRREKEHAAEGLVRVVRRPARLHHLPVERAADHRRVPTTTGRTPTETRSSSPDEIDLNSFAGFYNVDPSVAPNPANQLHANFKNPTTTECTAGIDHGLTDDFAVSATYT